MLPPVTDGIAESIGNTAMVRLKSEKKGKTEKVFVCTRAHKINTQVIQSTFLQSLNSQTLLAVVKTDLQSIFSTVCLVF